MDRGLTLVSSVYVRLRSLVFGLNAAMQVADVNGIRRTIIQTSEKRTVGGSTKAGAVRSVDR